MAAYYLDSSTLVKVFHQEPGTERLDGLLAEGIHTFHISSLVVVEVHSALLRYLRDRTLDEADVDAALAALRTDMADGVYHLHPGLEPWAEQAAALLRDLGAQIPLRALDAIHLAAALDLRRDTPDLILATSDVRLATATKAAGLAVLDPSKG